MGLMEQAKLDNETFTQNLNDFGAVLAFAAPGGETATVNGYYSDHSMAFDELGNPVTGKKSSVVVAEQPLLDAEYPTRNANNLIAMRGHTVTVTYADGGSVKFMVDEVQPDYTVNLITLFLSSCA